MAARPELSSSERRTQIDLLLDPLLDADVPEGERAALVVDVFRAVLAARMHAAAADRTVKKRNGPIRDEDGTM